MAKLVLADLVNLQNEPTAVGTINSNSALIEAALENTLSRDGTSPNTMGATLDMNSNHIINLPPAGSLLEPLRYQDLLDFTGGEFTNLFQLDVHGEFAEKNTVAATADLVRFYDGSASHPVTSKDPTFSISRYDTVNITGGEITSTPLYIDYKSYATSSSSGLAPTTGALIHVEQHGVSDVLGMGVEVQNHGGGSRFAYGYYANVWANAVDAAAYGQEINVFNDAADTAYATATTPYHAGAVYFAGGNHLNTVGVYFDRGVSGSYRQWDVGVAFRSGAIKSATIWDDSSSTVVLKTTGNHSTGIDLTGSTFIENAFQSNGFSVAYTGGITTPNILISAINGNIELGLTGTASTPFLDFHSSANSIDYDSRIIASGGTSTVGDGVLELRSNKVNIYNQADAPWIYASGPGTDVYLRLTGKGDSMVELYSQSGSKVSSRFYAGSSSVNYHRFNAANSTAVPTHIAEGTDTNIILGVYGKGSGGVALGAQSGTTGLYVDAPSNGDSYLCISGAPTGNSPQIQPVGTATDIGILIGAKNAGGVQLGSYVNKPGAYVVSSSSAVNYIQLAGNNTTVSPVISAQGSDTNISLDLRGKGTGQVLLNSDTTISSKLWVPRIYGGTGSSSQLRLTATSGNNVNTGAQIIFDGVNDGNATYLTLGWDDSQFKGQVSNLGTSASFGMYDRNLTPPIYGTFLYRHNGFFKFYDTQVSGDLFRFSGSTGAANIDSTVASTSYTTGALVVSGGVGIAGSIYSNANINAAGWYSAHVPQSSSSSSVTVDSDTYTVILGNSTTITLTLPTASTNTGRILYVKNTNTGAVNSAGSNVIALTGGSASTPILAAGPGKWAMLQSDGTNWIIMAAN